MTKTEVISAINETIRTNGNKGITADSLALILNEIVNLSTEEPNHEVLLASLCGSENEYVFDQEQEADLPEGVSIEQMREIFELVKAENKTIFDKAKKLILTGKTPIFVNSNKLMIEMRFLFGGVEPIYMRTIFIGIDYHGEYSLDILNNITNESTEIPDFIVMSILDPVNSDYINIILAEDGQAWEEDIFVDYYNNL